MWQVGWSSTALRKHKYRDVNHENGMNIILLHNPCSASGVEPAWAPIWNPYPVRQAFFKSSIQLGVFITTVNIFTTAHNRPLPSLCMSPLLCHCRWLLGYVSVCLVLLWCRNPVQDEKSVVLTERSTTFENKTSFLWIKGHQRNKCLKPVT